MKLDGYIRVSQVRGRTGDSFISPKVQRDQIERWAALREAEILKWHTDLDQSGAKDDRPGLVAALKRVESGETGGLVVAKLDRFARSLTGALDAITRITEAGGTFCSVADGIDPSTPAGKMQQNIMLVFAEFELDRIRENWDIAKRRAVARGVHIASRTPTGYRRRADGTLEPDPQAAQHVAELFRRRAGGESWRDLATYMNENNVVGPYNQANWTSRSMSHVIANPAYLGEARAGAHVNRDAHEPLIDRATWEAAQSPRVAPTASRNPALLSGLLRCAGCRHLMKPDTMPGRDGTTLRIYRCRGEHSTGLCGNRAAVMGRVIEPVVEREFFARIGDITAELSSETLARATERLVVADADLIAFRDSERISTALGTERFAEGLEKRAAVVDDARAELLELQRQQGLADIATGGTVSLTDLWPELDTKARQKLLMAAFDAVMIRSGRALPIDQRVVMLWRGDAPDDFPRRGRRVPFRPFDWPSDPDRTGTAAA